MVENPVNERRDYFRLDYPAAERPTIRYKGCDYRITEVSERGIKILMDRVCTVRVGQSIAGVIRFKDGGTVSVVGVVLRCGEKEMVVELTKGISLGRMTEEQRRIRQKYPMFFDRV